MSVDESAVIAGSGAGAEAPPAGIGWLRRPRGGRPAGAGRARRGAPVPDDAARPGSGPPDGPAERGGTPAGGRVSRQPRHRVGRRRRRYRPALDQPTGPHVRLGIVWSAVTLGALLLGPLWLAGWLTVVASMAAGSAARSWGTAAAVQRQPHSRRLLVQPPVPVTAGLTAVVALASALGATAVGLAAVIVGLALLAGATFGPLGQPDAIRRVLIVLAPGLAVSTMVLVRAHGLAYGLVLAGMVTVYDSSAYLIGTGAPNRWEGLFAGVASIAALTLFVAAVLAPPFTGSSPWLLGAAAAVLTPAGPALARWMVGDPSARVPALRRLDSLLLLGPAWLLGINLLVHH